MKFLIITPQTVLQTNKASTHFLIEELALRDNVENVDVLTTNLSPIKLIKDTNYSHINIKTILKGYKRGKINNKFVLFPIHFINLKNKILNKIISYLNIFFSFLYVIFSNKNKYVKYTHIIVVAGTPLILFNILKKLGYLNANTKIIYRVVDDLTTVNLNSEILKFENNLNRDVLVHSVNHELTNKYKKLGFNTIFTQNHAVDIRQIDKETVNPYSKDSINLIFVGMSMLDYEFLKIASQIFTDCEFWIIGPFENTIKEKNIHFLGKIPFSETIKYIKFADIGLQTLSFAKNVVSLQNTLKFQQYKYVRLPIIMPEYITIGKLNYGEFSYKLDEKSIKNAIEKSLKLNRDNIDNSLIVGWEEYTNIFLKYIG